MGIVRILVHIKLKIEDQSYIYFAVIIYVIRVISRGYSITTLEMKLCMYSCPYTLTKMSRIL